MDSPKASNKSSPGADAGATSSDVVNNGQRATDLGGVVVGIAQRPVIHCTEEGFRGLLSDFVRGADMKTQILNIKERRAGSA
ncbi:hypothetical protein ACHAP3_008987 [Botrytis cinerea]|uniref:Uncharacterized protein n=1 Tax=Botryotinia fuckeliana (strain T4) TaxID=999810 RepID=G2YWT7_BOTF4|nr:predicted protein [Botrytis cinerea T4]